MGVSRVDFAGETLVDLTGVSVAPNNLLKGNTALGADGELVEGAVVAVPTTTSLAVTQEGVSSLDGTVGKALNDKGAQMSVYKGDDGNLHFRNWAGADTVIPFNINGRFHVSLSSAGAKKRYMHFPTFGKSIHIWMIEATSIMEVRGANSITETNGTLLHTTQKSGFDTVIDCSSYEYVCFNTTSAYNGITVEFYLEYV